MYWLTVWGRWIRSYSFSNPGSGCPFPTGELTQGELYSAIKKEKEQTEAGDASTTHFSGEMHFYELVEDTKDGIWLVQVKALNNNIFKQSSVA